MDIKIKIQPNLPDAMKTMFLEVTFSNTKTNTFI